MVDLAVSVVVPTWRRAEWLGRCLRALSDQHRAPEEVIVVRREEDAAAHDITGLWASRSAYPIRWVEVHCPGHVAPVRRGVEEASGEIVAFLDDDTEPEPGWLGALLGPFADPRVACVGGRVVTPGFSGTVHRKAGRVRWYGKHVGNVGALETPGPVDVDGVMEGNWAWRSELLRGLEFDPVLDFDDASMYGLDLCLQAKSRRYRVVYEPGARVLHHAAPRDPTLDRSDRPSRVFAYSRNYTYIALKHLCGIRRGLFLGWWWLVGERGSYGIVSAAADVILRGNGVWPEIAASFAGKREGMTLWMAGRGLGGS